MKKDFISAGCFRFVWIVCQVIADSDEGSDKEDDRADPAPKRRRAIIASLFSKYSKPQHLMFG